MIRFLESKRWVSWTITFLIFFSIFSLSNMTIEPKLAGPKSPLALIYHFSAFFFLAFFLYVSALERKFEWKKISTILGIVISYAALDELHQYFVPGRFSSFSDFFVDSLGIILASLIYFLMIAIKEREL